MAKSAATLADTLAPDLDIVSIGLNPSLYSVEHGFYFARPQNRFWPAFNASGLTPAPLVPGRAAMQILRDTWRIGFTDVVKRPSRGAHDLKTADFAEWAPLLKGKLLRQPPRIAWFHGKLAWEHYLRHAEGVRRKTMFGLQPEQIGTAQVFVTPNPSPANAAFSLAVLTDWYRKLAALRDETRDQKRGR
ncbi:MAG: mismatch-specific DNA-glycosylase [Burkholderiales bacterium]